jgi:hypothetical protein
MKSQMKEIEKYVGYYLLVYICVLIVCGFFQYMGRVKLEVRHKPPN